MTNKIESTTPKPFIFILMPFDIEFDDIYKFGIKGAAEDVGAYAERVDEQIFSEGILERIFNQISKADVIIADMTGRNPNVFYEVGYAHALGKIVLLLTQEADDIPFDLKHRPHTVYAGKIETLREELTKKLNWAISESKRKKKQISSEQFLLSISGIDIPEDYSFDNVPVISFFEKKFITLIFDILNNSLLMTPNILYIYLFTTESSRLLPVKWYERDPYMPPGVAGVAGVDNSRGSNYRSSYGTMTGSKMNMEARFLNPIPVNSSDNLTKQFRLDTMIPSLPPGAVERFSFDIALTENQEEDTLLMIRIHSPINYHDFPLKIRLGKEENHEIKTIDLDQ